MTESLCETCQNVRAVITPKGARFLLCLLSTNDPAYPKYPPQPVVRCEGYRQTLSEAPKKEQASNRQNPHRLVVIHVSPFVAHREP